MIGRKDSCSQVIFIDDLASEAEKFILTCDYAFTDRYDARPDYLLPGVHKYLSNYSKQWILETNFIPDLRLVAIDPKEQTGSGVYLTQSSETKVAGF